MVPQMFVAVHMYEPLSSVVAFNMVKVPWLTMFPKLGTLPRVLSHQSIFTYTTTAFRGEAWSQDMDYLSKESIVTETNTKVSCKTSSNLFLHYDDCGEKGPKGIFFSMKSQFIPYWSRIKKAVRHILLERTYYRTNADCSKRGQCYSDRKINYPVSSSG